MAHSAPKPKPLEGAGDHQLLWGVCEAAEAGEKREPGDRDLERQNAAVTVRQHAADPAARRRDQEGDGRDHAGFGSAHSPRGR